MGDRRIARRLGPVLLMLPFLLVATSAAPQAISSEAEVALRSLVGDRVEAFVILGGDAGITGGVFGFDGSSDLNLQIIKVGGDGTIGEPKPLGLGDIKWAPIVRGNFGYLWADNSFSGTPIAGNHSRMNVVGAELGGGARFFLNEHVSLAPKLSLIYGRVWNDFSANNAIGRKIEQEAGGALVDWSLNSILLTPGIDLVVGWKIGPTILTFTSDYRYFAAWSFGESSPFISANGDSQVWMNKLDLDIPLGRNLFGRQIHTGGYYSRLEFFDDLDRALKTSNLNEAHARFALDVSGIIPRMKWIGPSGSYFWGEGFGGWSVGVDFRLGK